MPPRYDLAMTSVTTQEIERDFPRYLGRVAAGESLLILRGGVPVAEFKPIPLALPQPRPFGLCAGEFQVPDDFDAALPNDVLSEFEGT